MASHQDRSASPAEHLHDPARNSYRYIHLPDLSWINQKDPPEFDEALVQSLDQKRLELDAKVARYIAKKQGQFDDYVAEKNRRYEHRAEERRRRHHGHRQHQIDERIEESGAEKRNVASMEGEDDMTRFTKKQREEDARQRAARVSEEVSTQAEPTSKSAPQSPAHALGSVRERDSEIFQLLPGFLPLLDQQAALSSSAPVTNDRVPDVSEDPRSQLIRSCTVPAPSIHPRAAQPRRSSLKQASNGDRPGSARKAVRLSLGPRIVTPTQSPPDDRPLSSHAESPKSADAEAPQTTQDLGGKWDAEPRRTYHERIPDEELMAPGSAETHIPTGEKVAAPGKLEGSASLSSEASNQSEPSGGPGEDSAAEKILSPPKKQPPSAASPIHFSKGDVAQQLADYQGRRSSISEEVKALPKDQRRRKKKKDKARFASAPALNPSRSTATTALTSKSPEVDVPASRSIALSGGNPSIPNHPSSSVLLSSSFADANNTGLFYPTKSRPPPSPLRPTEEDLEAVDVPLPVGGFSSGSPSPTYDSTMGYSSLGESYMALNFARRMAEKEEKMKREETERRRQLQQQQILREESDEEADNDHLKGMKGDPIAKRIQEKRQQMANSGANKSLADQEDDGFIGELEL
ncbi:uncharacterized protein J3D65DRAFT_663893 [Phyllosticta citribraziliensis]|uniref:Uncharacterized protein n=1 Tax=Phyllosticta citribraziliensis TaxID=989973 RepID=A0ABR1M9V1_9PEZI